MDKSARLDVKEMPLSELRPAEYNPRVELTPEDEEYQKLLRDIDEFGYVDPIIINKDGTIIGGHQRYNVLKELGYKKAHVVIVDKSKAEEKALNIALNKIDGRWDEAKLAALIGDIDLSDLDATLTGFDEDEIKDMIGNINIDWFQRENRNDTSRQEGNDVYNAFLDKFEPAKTTDDCYTPDVVYDAVAAWVEKEYGLDKENFVRPFYPGGGLPSTEVQ
jgi:hypothetical protein